MDLRFRNRDDAAGQLAAALRPMPLVEPVVLAVPRGGVAIGVILARELHADLDVVLSRKLRAPWQPELAVGAVGEDGEMHVDEAVARLAGVTPEYLDAEALAQQQEIERRRAVIRKILPRASIEGRSVIVTDDGIATGSTLRAALRVARHRSPHELIVAVPVGPPDTVKALHAECDRVICLSAPDRFWAVGAAYDQFEQLTDAQVLELLRAFMRDRERHAAAPTTPGESPTK